MSDPLDSVVAWSCEGEATADRLTLDVGAGGARVAVEALPCLDETHPAARLTVAGDHLDLAVELTGSDAEQLADALTEAVEESVAATR